MARATNAFIDKEFAGSIGDASALTREDAAIGALVEFLAGRDRARATTLGCSEQRTLVLRNELMFAGVTEEASAGGRICAPMHGVLLEVLVIPGECV